MWQHTTLIFAALITISPAQCHNETCRYIPGIQPESEQCCSDVYKQFFREWASGEYYLTSFLASLKEWNCTQFEEQCNVRTFQYNAYTRLVYDRFCDNPALLQKCTDEVASVALAQNSSLARDWNSVVNGLDATKLTDQQLGSPCIQIAMYERDSGGFAHYHEVIQPFTPFCSFVWCGFDERLVEQGRISVWTCLPDSCRSSIVAMMVFSVILAIAIIVANATVLCALAVYPNIRHNQAIYRFSLALADILVGLIVFPTFVSSLYMQFHGAHELGELRNVSNNIVVNGMTVQQQSAVRDPSGLFYNRVPRSYLDAIGFFTVLSLVVSIYTLVAAGVDRCIALSHPARYQRKSAVPVALTANIFIWVMAIVFAVLPYGVKPLTYTLVASILISSSGSTVLVLYSIAFIIPLVLMWAVTIASYVISRNYVVTWRRYSRGEEVTDHDQGASEKQLARTFGIMVGVFSLSLVPSLITLICGIALETIYFHRPNELVQESAVAYTSTEIVVIFILMCNSLWNCFIYSVRDRDFRIACNDMYAAVGQRIGLRCCKPKRDTEVNNGNGITMATAAGVNGGTNGVTTTDDASTAI